MRLNLGCGEFYAQGWTNVDLTRTADINHDIRLGLPDVDQPIERIYAGHILEHLPYNELPAILSRWRTNPHVSDSTLLAVVGPDCDLGAQWVSQGRMTAHDLADMESGAHRWPGDSHLWRCTTALTRDALQAGGWTTTDATLAEVQRDGWPLVSAIGWQFALIAHP